MVHNEQDSYWQCQPCHWSVALHAASALVDRWFWTHAPASLCSAHDSTLRELPTDDKCHVSSLLLTTSDRQTSMSFVSTSQVFRHLHVCHAVDTVTDWQQEFLCSRTSSMEQPTDRDLEERHYHLRTLQTITKAFLFVCSVLWLLLKYALLLTHSLSMPRHT